MRAQIYLDERARAYRKDKPDRERVRHIHQEIIASDSDAIIISNKADEHGITPNKAKGLNEFDQIVGRTLGFRLPARLRGHRDHADPAVASNRSDPPHREQLRSTGDYGLSLVIRGDLRCPACPGWLSASMARQSACATHRLACPPASHKTPASSGILIESILAGWR